MTRSISRLTTVAVALSATTAYAADVVKAGCAAIFASHRMDEVFEIPQDFIVLRNAS
jgi:ABC-type sugar transport system ATPase subunit